MLVKVPQLRVAARTSSFSFKDKDLTVSDIAEELKVSNVLEGSVRASTSTNPQAYAMAWVYLQNTLNELTVKGEIPREESIPLMKDALDQALAADPELSYAWTISGYFNKYWLLDWETADAAISRARQLDPYSAHAVQATASMAVTLGQFDKAIEFYHRSLQLDPVRMARSTALGQAYRRARRFDDAISNLGKIAELRCDFNRSTQHTTILSNRRSVASCPANPGSITPKQTRL